MTVRPRPLLVSRGSRIPAGPRPLLLCIALGMLAQASTATGQQEVIILWQTKQPQSAPITVDQSTPVTVVVKDVNDLLYKYEGYATSEPAPPPNIDLKSISGALPRADKTCDASVKQQLTAIAGDMTSWQLNPWVGQDNKALPSGAAPNSVSLQTTQSFYEANIHAKAGSIHDDDADACGLTKQWADIKAFVTRWTDLLARDHKYSFPTTLQPLNNYTIHLAEYAVDATHPPQLTNACTSSDKKAVECTIKYNPQTGLVSASAGFLLSTLDTPTYERATSPTSSNAVLQVNGLGSINLLLAALVNVKVPCFWPQNPDIPFCTSHPDEWGWAVSVGPVFQLTGSSQTARLGLFAGMSLYFWKYVFITPGVHIGQFADYPAGFTHNGQEIPASFTGGLTPRTRMTARFALSITFKGFTLPGTGSSAGQLTAQSNTK